MGMPIYNQITDTLITMKKTTSAFIFSIPFVITACGEKIPGCGDQRTKDLVLQTVQKYVVGENNSRDFVLVPRFDNITTTSKSEFDNTCEAVIQYSYPASSGLTEIVDLPIRYKAQLDETDKTRMVITSNFNEVPLQVMNKSYDTKIRQSFVKSAIELIGGGYQDSLYDPIKDNLQRGGYTLATTKEKCFMWYEMEHCEHYFSKENAPFLLMVSTVKNPGTLSRGMAKLPVGEIVETISAADPNR